VTWTRGDAPLDVLADRFVGRSQARTALANWASQAWSGQLRLITVTGDPGIGKSALVDHVVAQWALEGATVLTATCHEDLSVPYLPILTALRAVTPRDDVGNPSIPARPDQIPGLFVTLADELIARATTTRVVLRIDDLHWVDPATT
jgi:predicted ATPase